MIVKRSIRKLSSRFSVFHQNCNGNELYACYKDKSKALLHYKRLVWLVWKSTSTASKFTFPPLVLINSAQSDQSVIASVFELRRPILFHLSSETANSYSVNQAYGKPALTIMSFFSPQLSCRLLSLWLVVMLTNSVQRRLENQPLASPPEWGGPVSRFQTLHLSRHGPDLPGFGLTAKKKQTDIHRGVFFGKPFLHSHHKAGVRRFRMKLQTSLMNFERSCASLTWPSGCIENMGK